MLHAAFSKDSLEYNRIASNKIWQVVQEDILKYFEPIVKSVSGDILVDKFLLDCYVRNYMEHPEEKNMLENLQKYIKGDINIYNPLKKFVDEKMHVIQGHMGSYEDFSIIAWKDLHFARALCGPKGTGKTTLMLFSKSDLEKNKRYKCFFVRLDIPAGGGARPWEYIRTKIVNRLDQFILEQQKTRGLDPKDIIIKRFQELWEENDAFPEPDDDQKELDRKSALRDGFLVNLHKYKFTHMFSKYIRWSIEYIQQEFNIYSIIMIDDIDRLEDVDTAKKIMQRTAGLAAELANVRIVVSAREETIALLTDVPPGIRKLHLIPPSFVAILTKRRNKFNREFTLNPKKAGELGLTAKNIKDFVNLVIDSILDDQTITNLLAFHRDIDVLLDIVCCILQSPFITWDYSRELIGKDKKIPWHIILDSMQRYIYTNFYDQNSYILNVFDNEEVPATNRNALIRLRLLQVLRNRYRGFNNPIKVGDIIFDMTQLGFEAEGIQSALKSFARQRLIVTGKIYNKFNDLTREILIQQAVFYYLDVLIYNYRYIQNILPVTPLSFTLPNELVEYNGPILGEKLKLADSSIRDFIKFISSLEIEEEKQCKNRDLLSKITRNTRFSEALSKNISEQIDSMKGI